MTDKAFVDAAQPATLNNGAGKLTDHPSLGTAPCAPAYIWVGDYLK